MTTHTYNDLNQLIEAVKNTKNYDNVNIVLGKESNVLINSIDTPIQLIGYLKSIYNSNKYKVFDEGPSLEWLSIHKNFLNNPNPNQVFYMHDMAISFLPHPHNAAGVTVIVFNKNCINTYIDTYINQTNYSYIKNLNISFNEFLKDYGYTNKNTYKDIAKIIVTFLAANCLGFTDPEQVSASFNDENLVVSLKLKGVFEYAKGCYPFHDPYIDKHIF